MRENVYLQTENVEYIINKHGKKLWVQVAGNSDLGNNSDAVFWSCLCRVEDLDNIMKQHSWETQFGTNAPGFYQSGDQVEYRRYSSLSETEPLAYRRGFYGLEDEYYEICEEFRLLNNLYEDRSTNTFYNILANGDKEEVAKSNNDGIWIKLSYLIKYATAKQKAILLFFDVRITVDGKVENNNMKNFQEKYEDDGYYFEIWNGNSEGDNNSYSVMMGKKVLLPKEISDCGYWPYSDEDDYEEYVIGICDDGSEKKYTSNPEKLSNYFGANPQAPHYLTPVYFKREVLSRYIQNSRQFSIEDGYIRCGVYGEWL